MKDREAEDKLESRIFVGGLSWDVTERQLHHTFGRFGKIVDCQIMVERDSGRSRGFGFITFSDRRAVDDAIKHMHGREFGDRVISVNKAEPKTGGDDFDHGHRGGGYSSRGKGSYEGGGRVGEDECFKCGRPGHWARDCPSIGSGRGGARDTFDLHSRFGGSDGHGDRFGDRERLRDHERYMDGRYDGGRYDDRDRFESGDKYGTRDRYAAERYMPPGDRIASDRYGMPERHSQIGGYGRERGHNRRGVSDRYGAMGPIRDEGRGYRGRPAPYDRPSGRGVRPSSFDRW